MQIIIKFHVRTLLPFPVDIPVIDTLHIITIDNDCAEVKETWLKHITFRMCGVCLHTFTGWHGEWLVTNAAIINVQ